MTPEMSLAIDAILAGIFAVLKASGMKEEEAKIALETKIAQIESLNPLPV